MGNDRKWRDPFWSGYKAIIRRYNGRTGESAYNLTETQKTAVMAAVSRTEALQDGEERLRLIDLVFWSRTHTLEGAAMELHISERTARRWHTEFIRLVGENLGI